MNYFTFLSKKDPTEIGYRVIKETDFDYRFQGVCRWGKFFQTYGDGLVQHSNEIPFQRERLEDFLGSLAVAIAEAQEPERTEILKILSKHWPRTNQNKGKILFALSLKCKAEKTVYVNMDECKTSFSSVKVHDRRWDAIRPYDTHVDGSIVSAAIMLKVGEEYDFIKGIDCPLCTQNLAGPIRMGEHLYNNHGVGAYGLSRSLRNKGQIGYCPCCRRAFFDAYTFQRHFKKNTDQILALLHAQILGVEP